jgi:hypothetical protein
LEGWPPQLKSVVDVGRKTRLGLIWIKDRFAATAQILTRPTATKRPLWAWRLCDRVGTTGGRRWLKV